MSWVISFFIIGSVVFMFSSRSTLANTAEQESHLQTSGLAAISQPKLLLLLPLVVMLWLTFTLTSMPFSFLTLATALFLATPIVLIVPQWRIALLPLATMSVVAVTLGIFYN